MSEKLRSQYSQGERPGTTRIELRRSHILFGILGILGSFFIISLIPGSISVASRTPEQGIKKMLRAHESARAWPSLPSTRDTFTILALGVAGGTNISPDLTDTILVIHITPGKRAAIFSIPRDLYVESSTTRIFRKINDIYRTDGIEALKAKVEEISGLTIDAYASIDLSGISAIIDAVGGIYVPITDDFNAYSYQNTRKVFEVPSGFRYFNGKDATAFMRYRPDSDFGRMHRQQLVLEALRKKLFGLHPMKDFNAFLSLFATVQSHLVTDLGIPEMKMLYGLATEQNLETGYYVFDNENLLRDHTAEIDGMTAYVLEPKAGRTEYRELQSYIQERL